MKILQIFGAVVAVHLLAFIFIFASPGCQSGPRNIPTPDATVPNNAAVAPITYDANPAAAVPVDLGTAPASPVNYSGHAAPTRPGSPAAAAITPAKSVADVTSVSTYTVGKGDSLWTIAKKNGLSVSELARFNKLNTGVTLKPGSKLMIPAKAGAPADLGASAALPATKAAAEKSPASGRPSGESVTHVVAPGESLGTIARKFQVKTGELAAVNNITDPSKVRAGQTLIIPGFKAVAPKAGGAGVKSAASAPAAAPAADTPPPAVKTPHFELTPPPQGQDLDAGLKPTSTEVPTIKVETPKADQPPKN